MKIAIILTAFISAAPCYASSHSYFKCSESSPAGNYKVKIKVKDNAFAGKSAHIYHADVNSHRYFLTTVVPACIAGDNGKKLECKDSLRSLVIFDDLTADYHGSEGVRHLRCIQKRPVVPCGQP
jgi:hypothetical protein